MVAEWILSPSQGRARRVIATSSDGFRTASYQRWTRKAWYAQIPFEEHPEPGPATGGLMSSPVTSLRPGTLGYVLGADGATLFPFARTARSTDDGRTWTTFEVSKVDGEQAFVNGVVVLADGRLLVSLNNWSGDKRGRPSKVHHGLWISDGDDWGTFAPYEPTFSPTLEATIQEWPAYQSLAATRSPSGPAIWTSSPEGLLYVSTDDGYTFTEIPAR